MGQTPPPWHGQAVATQILFDHDWRDFQVHRLRMEFSEEMLEVGRFQWKKIRHLFSLIRRARRILKQHPGCVLFYPPASAKWIPFLRDVAFLACVRYLAGSTVFIFHASGLPVFSNSGFVRRLLSRIAYHKPDVALEVAQEPFPAHEAFQAKSWRWCPCGISVPFRTTQSPHEDRPWVVLFVGSLQEGKGVTEILKTAVVLKEAGHEHRFRFRIVGKWFSTEYEEEISRLRSEWGLDHMVELVGQLTGEGKWDAYYDADAFFFPTHYASEATPIVLMEALGVGLPIISTDWAGIPAMLKGCQSAVILPIKSPQAYAEALVALASSAKVSNTSRAFYEEHYLPERFIERVESSWREATGITSSPCSPLASPSSPLASPCSPLASPCSPLASPSSPLASPSSPLASPCSPLASPCSPLASPCSPLASPISLQVYLADQNPGFDRSIGISRMTQSVVSALKRSGKFRIHTLSSRSSQGAPDESDGNTVLPWDTRSKWARFLTDHLHPLMPKHAREPDVYYYPKGYLPLFSNRCRPSVVTIHDTIIQHDRDHYPDWRSRWEYGYWSWALRHTLRHVDRIITISESSKQQIEAFMTRHRISPKKIHVTYEPCAYESIPQPGIQEKGDYVMHLGSREPHKKTAHLIGFWHDAEREGRHLPTLNLVGSYPGEASEALTHASTINRLPFLADSTLQETYRSARALILPSEIEGFGLPALEAYYLGTPVCFVKGTSVEEILSVATHKGGFSLNDPDSLYHALDEVLSMSPEEVRECGLKLREVYASERVAERMLEVFDDVKNLRF